MHSIAAKMMGFLFGWISKRILIKQMSSLKEYAKKAI